MTDTIYKFLTAEHKGPYSRFEWPVAGEWVVAKDKLLMCANGIHGCIESHLAEWLNVELWTIEIEGEIIGPDNDGKLCGRRGRLVERLEGWNETTHRLFAADCAERVLPIYENENPDDSCVRDCIATVRSFARGESSTEKLRAARNAVQTAKARVGCDALNVRNAAWSASMAHLMIEDVKDASFDARYVMGDLAERSAECEWQSTRLLAYARGEIS